MQTDPQRLEELAALNALGSLTPEETEELGRLLAAKTPDLAAAVAAMNDTAAALALAESRSWATPPRPEVKQSLMARIASLPKPDSTPPAPASAPAPAPTPLPTPFVFLNQPAASDWIPLAVPGAYARLLHLDKDRNYAVVLGRLDPGAVYPEHSHTLSEQIYVLSGDLHIGDRVLQAGDFHSAANATRHGVNKSISGCTILAVISEGDLLAQLQAT